MINAKTKLCCVIGSPVGHSLSPTIHNAAYEALGLNYVYVAFDITNVKTALEGLKTIGVEGISVTLPHKETVLKYLDEIDTSAQKIGAVNTIYRKDGKFCGTNTDWLGALKALEEKISLRGKTVSLIGAGGTSRSLAYALKNKDAKVRVFNRNLESARELMNDFQLTSFHLLDETKLIAESDLVVNTTPVGMTPDTDKSPIPPECINSKQTVFDIIFAPKETKLLQYAKKQKAGVVYGYKMLLYQAIPQFELFTGYKAPVEVMERVLKENSV